ncbi:tryptophan 7-halogenase [Sphingomonas sp. LT1P40]|uniref:tryptophan 7-halogenase n=1 Tax=Alteristakelama amylovorans TaxID=3096166 RepID=UPI002FCC4316
MRKVAVLGGGVAAAMAALAIRRAYGRLGTEVTWVDSGEAPPAHAALIAPPDLATFHRLLRIDDAALISRASATLNMGQQFAGWAGSEEAFLHAYGDAGSPFASLPFVQHWTRARRAGMGVALEEFCLAAVAAKQGRFGASKAQAVKHGWHLDAAGYAALLRAACVRDGVRIVEALDAEADLIVDASSGQAGGNTPLCDRVIRASAQAFDPVPLFSRVTAHAAGWMTLIPLSDRTAIEFFYDSRSMSEAAADAALHAANLSITGQSVAVPVAGGPHSPSWVGNRVRIGDAASPLDAAELLSSQLSIAQLILLWPIDRDAMPEADIYNDEMAGSRARIAEFSAQHFRLNGRSEPFWEAARAAPVSHELESKISLFAARGMFAHHAHEAHVEDGWALCMAGHGVVPRSHDPQALLVEDQALMAEFQRQLRSVAAEVRGMETHAEALARMRRPAA